MQGGGETWTDVWCRWALELSQQLSLYLSSAHGCVDSKFPTSLFILLSDLWPYAYVRTHMTKIYIASPVICLPILGLLRELPNDLVHWLLALLLILTLFRQLAKFNTWSCVVFPSHYFILRHILSRVPGSLCPYTPFFFMYDPSVLFPVRHACLACNYIHV
jgi:hypothetical protein